MRQFQLFSMTSAGVLTIALLASCTPEKPKASMTFSTTSTDVKKSHGETASEERQPAAARGVYVVQIGAFKVKDNAKKLQERLAKAGHPVMMRELNHSKNGMLYLVHSPTTLDRKQADYWMAQLKTKSEVNSQVVRRID